MSEAVQTGRASPRPVTALDSVLLGACVVYYAVVTILVPASGADFVVFWSAGKLALLGEVQSIYDWQEFTSRTAAMVGDARSYDLPWRSPPVYLLLMAAFGSLDYEAAWVLWQICSVSVACASLWLVHRRFRGVLLSMLAPAALICAMVGQNGFLCAALLSLAIICLDKRPVCAGIAISFLMIKPQFGIVIPLFLAFTARWRAFFSACMGSIVLIGLSMAAFGSEIWVSFFGSLSESSAELVTPGESRFIMHFQSMHALAIQLGLPAMLAWSVHGVTAAAAVGIAIWTSLLARRRGGPELHAPALLAAVMLATPYVLAYDQVVLGVAAMFLAAIATRTGWLAWERLLMAASCLLPAVAFIDRTLAVGPLAWLILLGLVVRRAAMHDLMPWPSAPR